MRQIHFGVFLMAAVMSIVGVSREVRAQGTCQVHSTEEARRTEARSQFQRGQELFDGNSFEPALSCFECSFRNVPHPSTLYNIARAAELTGNFSRALDAWRGYLQMSPDAEDRAEIEERIRGLEQASASSTPTGTGGTAQQQTWNNPTPTAAAAPTNWETPTNINTQNAYTPTAEPGQDYQMVETVPPSPWRRYSWGFILGGALLSLVGIVLATPIIPAASQSSAEESYTTYDPFNDGSCENPDAWVEVDDGMGGVTFERNEDEYRVHPGCWIAGAALAGVGASAMLAGVFILAFAERGGSRVVTRRASFSPTLMGSQDGGLNSIGGTFSVNF